MEKLADINVGLIGAGNQGQTLLHTCLRTIGGLQFRAVCDIWDYNRSKAANSINAYNPGDVKVAEFVDYRQMLSENDKLDLDAVIVATPDWMHAACSIAAMNAGLHVYCEKEMSNSVQQARRMVITSRNTQKLLQIGRQRRSNPRYLRAINDIVMGNRFLGRIRQGYAQWGRRPCRDIGWPAGRGLGARDLARHGYDTMSRLRNWRSFRKFSGGPIADLASHQIDIFNWVFRTGPKSVIASGSGDYYKHRQWYDNVMCIFEYDNQSRGRDDGDNDSEKNVARAACRVNTASSYGGFSETLMGPYGTLVISEVPQFGNWLEREIESRDFNQLTAAGLTKKQVICKEPSHRPRAFLRCHPSLCLLQWPLRTELKLPPHQPHLSNFFDAIRGKAKLNCPGEIGYQTAVASLAVNQAIRSQKKINFTKEQFEI